MGDPVSKIRRDYRAVHTSGIRPESEIHYIVIHDGEAPSPTGAAEGMGRWFENPKSGGSTHFGVDNDSTQQYLSLEAISWGAPPLNQHGVHIECAGKASLTRAQWLKTYGPMLERVGWLIADLHKRLGIPIKVLTVSELKAAGAHPSKDAGIVTHAAVSRVFHKTTHTDPGPGFPMDVVIAHALRYAKPKPQPRPDVKTVDAKGLNLRAGAGTKYRVLAVLHHGDRVTVLRTIGEWANVKTAEGTGYVAKGYLR